MYSPAPPPSSKSSVQVHLPLDWLYGFSKVLCEQRGLVWPTSSTTRWVTLKRGCSKEPHLRNQFNIWGSVSGATYQVMLVWYELVSGELWWVVDTFSTSYWSEWKKPKPFSKKEWNKNLKQVLRSFPEALISIRAETYLWELLQYPMMEDTKH